MGVALYALTHMLAPGRTRSAVFAMGVVVSCRSLVWYQALPAVLLEALGWLMLAASSVGSSAGGGGGMGGARGRGGGGKGQEEEDEARGPEPHEVPYGGRLAPEHVKGATGGWRGGGRSGDGVATCWCRVERWL